jgi:hypothetical protein
LQYSNETLTSSANDSTATDDTGYKESGVANWKRAAGVEAFIMFQRTAADAGNAILGFNSSKQSTMTARTLPVGMFIDPATGDVYVKDTGVDFNPITPEFDPYARQVVAMPVGNWSRIRIGTNGTAYLETSSDKASWSLAYTFVQTLTGDAYPTAVLYSNPSAKMYKPQLGTGLIAA